MAHDRFVAFLIFIVWKPLLHQLIELHLLVSLLSNRRRPRGGCYSGRGANCGAQCFATVQALIFDDHLGLNACAVTVLSLTVRHLAPEWLCIAIAPNPAFLSSCVFRLVKIDHWLFKLRNVVGEVYYAVRATAASGVKLLFSGASNGQAGHEENQKAAEFHEFVLDKSGGLRF